MLVKLYNFVPSVGLKEHLAAQGIYIKRAISPERSVVTDWVLAQFGRGWADECGTALSNMPSTCFVAYKDGAVVGFACCEATAPNFFGPTGVEPSMRKNGVGRALLEACLEHQKSMGYAYSIIGSADKDAVTFYEKCCGAVSIEGSAPGIYRDMLRKKP